MVHATYWYTLSLLRIEYKTVILRWECKTPLQCTFAVTRFHTLLEWVDIMVIFYFPNQNFLRNSDMVFKNFLKTFANSLWILKNSRTFLKNSTSLNHSSGWGKVKNHLRTCFLKSFFYFFRTSPFFSRSSCEFLVLPNFLFSLRTVLQASVSHWLRSQPEQNKNSFLNLWECSQNDCHLLFVSPKYVQVIGNKLLSVKLNGEWDPKLLCYSSLAIEIVFTYYIFLAHNNSCDLPKYIMICSYHTLRVIVITTVNSVNFI